MEATLLVYNNGCYLRSRTVFSFIKFNRGDNNRKTLIGMAKSWLQLLDDRDGCLIYHFGTY